MLKTQTPPPPAHTPSTRKEKVKVGWGGISRGEMDLAVLTGESIPGEV